MSCKYGIREMLRKNPVDIERVDLSEESAERAIAYIQMNCVAANICLHPSDYPWGTGNAFFKVKLAKGTPINHISKREQIRLLHSKVDLPSSYLLGEDGYILAFKDQVIAAGVKDLCHALFHKRDLSDLTPAQQAEILKQIRYRFSSHI